jgi:hypothetical protein
MRYLDRAFAVATGIFILGSLTGFLVVVLTQQVRDLMIFILQMRMLTPIQTVSGFGKSATSVLIFLNNSIPPLLSYLYPLLIMKVRWTPPLSRGRQDLFMWSFTALCSFLIGAFNLGAVLALGWKIGGPGLVLHLLSTASVHGPLEFLFILLCVAEPLRIALDSKADRADRGLAVLRNDVKLLMLCLLGLLVSALIEAFVLL